MWKILKDAGIDPGPFRAGPCQRDSGAYGVSRRYLGGRSSLVAGASLIIDYVPNVAVSVAAGTAALTSAFPNCCPTRCGSARPRSRWSPGSTTGGSSKFTEGGWLILVALPAMVALMEWVLRRDRATA
ncbi:hypothetical protein GCM10010191_59420 [Actinomadura vinacea]|uniref:Uncharacterized protein n=1 Tax=Actinomadura vinacea TaxID=115336 RepID=A0ABN3JPT1_9ACTN